MLELKKVYLFAFVVLTFSVGNALPDSSPRFLVVRYDSSPKKTDFPRYLIALDSARQQPTLALIHFNPLDTEVPIKMMYQATKPLILQELKGVKEFYLTNTSDFTPEYFSHKVKNKNLQNESSGHRLNRKTF